MDFWGLIFDPGINFLGFWFFPRLLILVNFNPVYPPPPPWGVCVSFYCCSVKMAATCYHATL